MKELTQLYKENSKVIWLFLLAIVAIVFFLPRAGIFKYEFQKGKTWMHEDLYSPFDYPLYKSDVEILQERNNIESTAKPYYAINLSIEQEQLPKLITYCEINPQLKPVEPTLLNLLDFVYNRGILNASDLPSGTDGDYIISVMRGSVSEDYPVSELFTKQSAIDYINSGLYSLLRDNDLKEEFENLDIKQYIVPNLLFDKKVTEQVKQNLLSNIALTKGIVVTGEKIISKGELVNNDLNDKLRSLKHEYEENRGFVGNYFLLLTGQFFFVALVMFALLLLLLGFSKTMLFKTKNLLFVLCLIVVAVIGTSLMLKYAPSFIYLVPYTIVPIYLTTFFGAKRAIFVHLILLLLLYLFVPNGSDFLLINFFAGIAAVYSFRNIYRRGRIFIAIGVILLSYCVSYIAICLMQEASFQSINWRILIQFVINVQIILFAYQLIYPIEKIFGFLSGATLVELSDTNRKLLRELAEKAPGTMQHCLQVANLSEAVIREIGGNPLLMRAGALYHDIGKMENPKYFIENQSPDYNPHSALNPLKSAEIIISHVTDGIKIAKRAKLPNAVIDFIRTHHGTSKVYYFYKTYLDTHPEAEGDERFVYPGPLPSTKETAVLMATDAVEAASRSLHEPTAEDINKLVDKIIDFQLSEGMYNNAPITMNDITTIKEILKDKLQGVYHVRIEYPKLENTTQNN